VLPTEEILPEILLLPIVVLRRLAARTAFCCALFVITHDNPAGTGQMRYLVGHSIPDDLTEVRSARVKSGVVEAMKGALVLRHPHRMALIDGFLTLVSQSPSLFASS
jgi:hypothetical protein